MQRLYLALSVQHLAELRQCLLFVDLRRLHCFMQSFHRILQLPLKVVEARGCALNLAPHEGFLLISQTQLALMLHDHVRGKHGVSKRIVGRGKNDFSSVEFSFSCGSDLKRLSLDELSSDDVGDCQLESCFASCSAF